MVAFHAYRTAYEAGRYADAEAPAQGALDAAEAVGDGRAGVLALNLALLRALHLQKLTEAHAPAERALALGGDGVDPDQLRLLLELTELPSSFAPNSDALERDIAAARARPAPATGFLYDLSMAWGLYALQVGHGRAAETAFTNAAQLAENERDETDRTVTLTALGVAEVLQEKWEAAASNLDRALTLILPLAPQHSGTPNDADRALGQAYAWRYYVSLKSSAPDPSSPLPLRPGPLDVGASAGAPVCRGRLDASPMPHLQAQPFREAVVVLWYDVNEAGELTNVNVIGSVPSTGFPGAVMRVAPQWRYRWDGEAQNCSRHAEGVRANVRIVLNNEVSRYSSSSRRR